MNKQKIQKSNKHSSVVETALDIILSMLPLHAEEGRRRESVSESELRDALIAHSIPESVATTLLAILRRQFEALALLDLIELRYDRWAFISFPASLLGRSWLSIQATPGQALFAPGYWGQDAPEGDREVQRELLRQVETARVDFNFGAKHIRVVHVAWALIRMGGKFLMYHREDKARSGQKSYGLPGGRFKLDDLPVVVQERQDILKELFCLDSPIVNQHIGTTLARELKEEIDLSPDVHYTSETFGKPLPPYMEVNGAGNKHAYSAYCFHLYTIKLTHRGETHLLAQISRKQALTWFAANDIIAQQRADGACAYVDALHHAWGDEMEQRIQKVPESGTLAKYKGKSRMLDLPGAFDAAFQTGMEGKEKAARPVHPLEDAEWQFLMLLGWHARNFPITMTDDSVVHLMGNGWIEMPGIIDLAHSLHQKIESVLPGLLEIREDCFVSLRISPDILFFSTHLFRYRIRGSEKSGGTFQLRRLELTTDWGRLNGDLYERDITGKMVTTLRNLEKGDDPEGDWERSLRDQFGEGARTLGLRRFWSCKGNTACLVDGLMRSP